MDETGQAKQHGDTDQGAFVVVKYCMIFPSVPDRPLSCNIKYIHQHMLDRWRQLAQNHPGRPAEKLQKAVRTSQADVLTPRAGKMTKQYSRMSSGQNR